ncbi:MAG: hypothetical protein ACE5ES_00205 [Candidatus Nanoarchaeia archaeon]
MIISSELEFFWKNFYRNDFRREFVSIPLNGYVQRFTYATLEELSELFWMYNGYTNIYTGIYSLNQQQNDVYDRIYIDFDDENIEYAYKEAITLKNIISEQWGGSPLLVESGNKGYNIYVFFKPTKINHFQQTMRILFDKWKSSFKTLDMSVVGQKNRVSRIPYSINMKGKRKCLPFGISFEESNIADFILEIDNNINNNNINNINNNINIDEEDIRYIMNIMANLPNISGSGWNRAMFHILAPMLAQKYNYSTAVLILDDFLEKTNSLKYRSYCINQLRAAKRKNIKPMRLDTFLWKYPELYKYFANR